MKISVVVPTRNRPADLAACLSSILACDPFEVVVVDQGERGAPHLPDDPRIRWLRCPPRGVCVGRNLGIEHSTGEVIAITDDDCRVEPGWLAAIAAVFDSDPEVALAFGVVRVPDKPGHAASFKPVRRVWQHEFPPPSGWGIGANMGVRRSALERVGPFDPALGVGGELRSGGEPELSVRVLRAGLKIVHAEEFAVLHLGLRPPGAPSRALLRQYGYGTAAGLVKHVRLGERDVAFLYLRFLATFLGANLRGLLRGRLRESGLNLTLGFLQGTLGSFKLRIDRKSGLYDRPPSSKILT